MAGVDPALLVSRPANGGWSILDNVRRMFFAEQLHLGRFVPGPALFSANGLPQDGVRNQPTFAHIATADPDLQDLLDESAAYHEAIRPYIPDAKETYQAGLRRVVRHQQQHIEVIGRMLRRTRETRRKLAVRYWPGNEKSPPSGGVKRELRW